LQAIASTLFIIAACAAALPFVLGYAYAWTWVLPYTSVCKSSLLDSHFTAEEYDIYLLNHGCNVDDEIRRYVRDWYASLDRQAANDLFFPRPGPSATPQEKVRATAERVIVIFQSKAERQNAEEALLADAVRSYLSHLRPFRFADQDCEGAFCLGPFWGDDVVSQAFASVSGKYLSFAEPLLLKGIDLGAVQVAAVWEEGPLLRGGLLLAYTLATGVFATALFEFVKWRLKD
jgi:hypothetical protein